jgi:hypothetical protein
MVHGSWTDGAPRSTVHQSSVGVGAAMAHGRRAARRVRGLTVRASEGEQGRARPGDGSSRQDRRRRGSTTVLEIAMVVASRRRRCKCLRGEGNKGEGECGE